MAGSMLVYYLVWQMLRSAEPFPLISIISFRPGELLFLLLHAAWLFLHDRLGLLGASGLSSESDALVSSLEARSSMLSGTTVTDNQLAA